MHQRAEGVTLGEVAEGLKALWAAIIRGRRAMLLPVLLASIAGLALAFGIRAEYTAILKLVPYRSRSVSAEGLSGLAGLAGIRLPASGVGEMTIGSDLYPEIVKSLEFRIAVSETPLRFQSNEARLSALEYFRVVDGVDGLRDSITLRPHARGNDATSSRFTEDTLPRSYSRAYIEAVESVGKRIAVLVDRKTGIVTLSATLPDPLAAAELARVTSQQLMRTVLKFDLRKADEQLRFLEVQLKESQARYDSAQKSLAMFLDANRVLVTAVSQIERRRLEREVEQSFELTQKFSQEVEQARIRRSQDTPVFAILEEVTVPNQRSRPNRPLIVGVGVIVGLLLGIGRVVLRSDS